MLLYHFTAKVFLDSIKKAGLNQGAVLLNDKPIQFAQGYIWLTKNPDFDQSWSVGTGRLPYKRNEVRFDVNIPKSHERDLFTFSQLNLLLHFKNGVHEILGSQGDPENWFVYEGKIPRSWLKKIKHNPN